MYTADRFFRKNQECFKVSDSAGNTVTRRHFTVEECSTPDRDSFFKLDGRVGLRGVEYEVVGILTFEGRRRSGFEFDRIHATSETGVDASWNADVWAILATVRDAYIEIESGPSDGLASWNVTIQSW